MDGDRICSGAKKRSGTKGISRECVELGVVQSNGCHLAAPADRSIRAARSFVILPRLSGF